MNVKWDKEAAWRMMGNTYSRWITIWPYLITRLASCAIVGSLTITAGSPIIRCKC